MKCVIPAGADPGFLKWGSGEGVEPNPLDPQLNTTIGITHFRVLNEIHDHVILHLVSSLDKMSSLVLIHAQINIACNLSCSC